MNKSEPTLLELFPKVYTDNEGIFEFFVDAPWYNKIPSEYLNADYFLNHSGSKFCSPIVKSVLGDKESLEFTDREFLARMIYRKNKINLERLWDTYVVEYNPIDNYNMTETSTKTITNSDKVITSNEYSSTKETTYGSNDSETTYQFGYNSPAEEKNPTDLIESNRGGSDTDDSNSTEEGTKRTDGIEIEGASIHRQGNIGVTTNQKMIKDERDIWNWNFFESLFSIVDKELTLYIYDPCLV